MCGISVLLSPSQTNIVPHLQAMHSLIPHRGPDDEGFALFDHEHWALHGGTTTPPDVFKTNIAHCPTGTINGSEFAYLGMAHRRLSIVDLSPAGHQPFCDQSQRYFIVYNGEIYNYQDLRTSLIQQGYSFNSQTDTEVILAAYIHWGAKCLQYFNGMFAFCIYDRLRQMIFVARDQFNIKPLYYWISPLGYVAFASEVKQFTVLPGWHAQLNNNVAYQFLMYSYLDFSEETFFTGVKQLKNGQYIEQALHDFPNITLHPWYEWDETLSTSQFNEHADLLDRELQNAIALRADSVVPIGTCLSGGIDSSTIACMTHQYLKRTNPQQMQFAFSARCEVAALDEGEYIAATIAQTGMQHHEITPEFENLQQNFAALAWTQDEPFAGTSIFAEWKVFQLASKQGIKITLDGHGADELFAGYHTYISYNLANLLARGQYSLFLQEFNSARKLYGYSLPYLLRQSARAHCPDWLRVKLESKFRGIWANNAWLDDSLKTHAHLDTIQKWTHPKLGVEHISLGQILHMSLPAQLHKCDRNSMAHSIESRVPFLDPKIVKIALTSPNHFKLHKGIPKYILRHVSARYIPEKVAQRREKIGFATPEAYWLAEKYPNQLRDMMQTAVQQCNGLVSDDVLKIVENIIARKQPYHPTIWRIISFGQWLETFRLRTS